MENDINQKNQELEKRLQELESKLEKQEENKKEEFNFNKYKETVDQNDIEKLIDYQKDGAVKWFYFIPFFGIHFYQYFYYKTLESLDRGFTRKELYRWNTRYILYFFILLPFSIIINFLPFITKYLVIRKVLKLYEQHKITKKE